MHPLTRRRLYWTARGVFVSDQAHIAAFDAVFRAVFGAGAELTAAQQEATRDASREQTQASYTGGAAGGEESGEEVEIPRAVAGDEERLASRRFDALAPGELAQLYRLMAKLELAPPLRRTRRYERGRHGRAIDLRRTLRGGLRSGGEPIRLAHRRRRVQRRRLVLLCDISGSMEPYARAYLQLLAAAAGSGPRSRRSRSRRGSPASRARSAAAIPSAPSSAPRRRRRTGRAGPGSATR